MRGDKCGIRSQLDRDSLGRRARATGSAAAPAERDFGSAGGRDYRARLRRDPAGRHGAVASGGRSTDWGRRVTSGHVRRCRTRDELPGKKRVGNWNRGLASGTGYAGLDDRRWTSDVFRKAEAETRLEARHGRIGGIGIEVASY